jgi:predicted DNA-binding protein
LKVKIPLTYHVRLHSMKIMTGRPISAVVREALDRYFRDEAKGEEGLGGAGDGDEKSG